MVSTRSLFDRVFGSGGLFEKAFGADSYVGWSFAESRLTKTADASTLRRELPGWKASDIHVEVKGNVLEISGKRNKAPSNLCPIALTENFLDTYPIIGNILVDQVTAKLERGVLVVTLPHDKARLVVPRIVTVTEE